MRSAGLRAEAAGPSAPSGKPDGVDMVLAARWRAVVRSRQVHGRSIQVHGRLPRGVRVTGEGDGHATGASGVLLTVTLADCVPVFIVDPPRRTVALLHAGWRGTAAGVVEAGLDTLSEAFGSDPKELLVHLGPAICADCYEVGPEVFHALGEAAPVDPAAIDLRSVIRRRTIAAGVSAQDVTVSGECTLCGDGRYYSHRRGDRGRHRGYIGIRDSDDLRTG